MKMSTITRFLAKLTIYTCSVIAVFQLQGASMSALRAAGQRMGNVSRVYFHPSRPAYASSRTYSGVGVGVGGRFGELGTLSLKDIRQAIPAVAPNWQELHSSFKELPQQSKSALRSTFERKPQSQQGTEYGRVAMNELIRLYSDQIRKDEKVLSDMYRAQDALRGQLLQAKQALQNIDLASTTGSAWNTYADLSAKIEQAQQAFTEHSQKMVAQAELIQALKNKRYSLQQK